MLHSAAIGARGDVVDMRRRAITELRRIFDLARDEATKAEVLHAMSAAGRPPNNTGYSDELGIMIVHDLVGIVGFYRDIAASMPLEPRRRLEVELFTIFYRYHRLPEAMAGNAAFVEAQAALIGAIEQTRAVFDADAEYRLYRTLVGHDSVLDVMWESGSYDLEARQEERAAAVEALTSQVTADTAEEWRQRLERFVETRSDDLATFLELQNFIRKVAAREPDLVLGWLPRLTERLANWLPNMLHGLVEAGRGEDVETVVEQWVDADQHASELAWYMQFAERFDVGVLKRLTERAIDRSDLDTLGNVVRAAVRQYSKHPKELINGVLLPAVGAFAARRDYRWVGGGFFTWQNAGILGGLDRREADELLGALIGVRRLDDRGVELLAGVAAAHPASVLDFIGRRYALQPDQRPERYEEMPYNLWGLDEALGRHPEALIVATRAWFDRDPDMFEYRGGRIIAETFPEFEAPIQALLEGQLADGRRSSIEFVLSILRAYDGQVFLHPLLMAIVDRLEDGDELLQIVDIIVSATGVTTGEYGRVEAIESARRAIADWTSDERAKVRAFAAQYIRSAENDVAWQRRQADQSVALRRIAYGS